MMFSYIKIYKYGKFIFCTTILITSFKLIIPTLQPSYTNFFKFYNQKSRQRKVTNPLHPPAFHLYSHHYHFHNIWMLNHRHTTKYHLLFDLRLLGDKVFHCVFREEFLKLTIQLCCKCFIVRYDQGWLSPINKAKTICIWIRVSFDASSNSLAS